jgi:uncharacterized membrane protein
VSWELPKFSTRKKRSKRGRLPPSVCTRGDAMGQVLGLVVLGMAWQALAERNRPGQGIVLTAMALTVAVLVGLAGIWTWRRWGVYPVGILAIIGVVSDALLGTPAITILVRIGFLAMLGFQVKQQWASFR